jgi:effector-binding domain-containing protein
VKKLFLLVSVVLLLVLSWYLFVRQFDFEVNFKARTLPGDIIQSLKIWNNTLSDADVLSVDSVYSVKQRINWNDRSYLYVWNFEIINDSVTQVNVLISEPGNHILNRVLIPFSKPQIEVDAGKISRQFYDIVKSHLEITSVEIVGGSTIAPSFCVCRTIETLQTKKANGMMKNNSLLSSFIHDSGLKASGLPSVRVREWNHSSGKLKYDFCFPIERQANVPASDSVTYQDFKGQKAIKAIYHGNYITSDRSWYELINYAQKNGNEIIGGPIELFYNNPNLGGDESKWKAEVFLPIK